MTERRGANPMKLLVAGLAVFGLVFGYGCFGPPGTVACGSATGFGPAMLSSIEHCPAALEKLGAPIGFGMIGVSCGNYEAGGDAGDGNAWGDGLPIAGKKSEARLAYVMSKGGGVWSPSKLVLSFGDGSKLDVRACSSSYQAAQGDEALHNILVKGCDEGVAATCEGLAATLEAKGDAAGAKAAREKACQLGLASACR